MTRKTLPLFLLGLILALPVQAEERPFAARVKEWRETREHRAEGKKTVMAEPSANLTKDTYGGREILLHIAPNVPSPGRRALVVVLHGGMGNAGHIQRIIGMDNAADEGGYIVAYLNGSRASRLNEKFHAWNAGGGCCGQPFKKNVDDIAYIKGAVGYIAEKYGVDKKKIFGMGHSNGAMMTQRLMCETDLYQAIIPISGPLNIDAQSCPPAYHKKVLAIHGVLDKNVPIEGGYGTKGVTDIDYKSQSYSKGAYEESSATYTLDAVEGADHSLATIRDTMFKRDERTLGQTASLFFGLAPK